ncbi:MAG: polysaccharide biosynthesis protein, partial [Candidatus Hydrogenedentes bacterium]|nr:polysaccharide biosynthesis protein [Candidatus Hydrogenedentota bacterium]
PLTIFGFATAAAVLPAATRAAARNDIPEMRNVIVQGLRQSFFMILPSMIGLIVIGKPIVKLLFFWGHTRNDTDIDNIAIATAIYAAGLLSFAWVKVTVSGFFAVKDTRSPVIISSASMVLNMLLCAVWVKPYGYQGLAWATTISYTVNFAALYALLCARHGNLWDAVFATALVRMSAATAGMAAVGYAAYLGVIRALPGDHVAALLTHALVPIAAAVVTYLALAWMFGVSELHSFAQLVQRRLGKRA